MQSIRPTGCPPPAATSFRPVVQPVYSSGYAEIPQKDTDVFFDRGYRPLVVAGIIFSFLCGIAFILVGCAVWALSQFQDVSGIPSFVGWDIVDTVVEDHALIIYRVSNESPSWTTTLLQHLPGLMLNALITLCSEATGYVHANTLKWSLARENRLNFNANVRLFRTSGGFLSANSYPTNILFGVSLIISYAASSAIIIDGYSNPDASGNTTVVAIISFLPPALVGIAICVQAFLALIGFLHTHPATWNSSQFDVAPAILHTGQPLHRIPDRCMRPAADSRNASLEPVYPNQYQPSAWATHPAVRVVVILVWTLIPCGGVWAFVVYRKLESLDPNSVMTDAYVEAWRGVVPPFPMIIGLGILAGIQSVLTLGMHFCEVVILLIRDEKAWRKATTKKGAAIVSNPLRAAATSWENVTLFAAKSGIHWLFGRAISIVAGWGVQMFPVNIIILTVALIPLAVFITVLSLRHFRGPQPSAYGHVQTLLNLVDEWPLRIDEKAKKRKPRLYWGHKTDGPPCHAGTSDHPMLAIKMDQRYAGEVVTTKARAECLRRAEFASD